MDKMITNALFFEPTKVDDEDFLDYFIIGEKQNYYENKDGYYNFFTCAVPRVSNILKETVYDEDLINWFKCVTYDNINRTSNNALRVGSIVHESIEKFLINEEKGIEFDFKKIPFDIIKEKGLLLSENVLDQMITSYDNFTTWYFSMRGEGYFIKVLDIERPTINPWFGGTIDCIMQISHMDNKFPNKTFIIDFKTSKKITINYWLQTYAYYWSYCWENLNIIYPKNNMPKIDGIGILRLPKNSDHVQFETLDFTKDYEQNTVLQLHYAFRDMINWYYSKHNIEKELIL